MLCRKKASDILAFVLTDTDRLSNQTTPHHLLLAYALKGYSMTGKQRREMSSDAKQDRHVMTMVSEFCAAVVTANGTIYAFVIQRTTL